jgi:hypothetical protein
LFSSENQKKIKTASDRSRERDSTKEKGQTNKQTSEKFYFLHVVSHFPSYLVLLFKATRRRPVRCTGSTV